METRFSDWFRNWTIAVSSFQHWNETILKTRSPFFQNVFHYCRLTTSITALKLEVMSLVTPFLLPISVPQWRSTTQHKWQLTLITTTKMIGWKDLFCLLADTHDLYLQFFNRKKVVLPVLNKRKVWGLAVNKSVWLLLPLTYVNLAA